MTTLIRASAATCAGERAARAGAAPTSLERGDAALEVVEPALRADDVRLTEHGRFDGERAVSSVVGRGKRRAAPSRFRRSGSRRGRRVSSTRQAVGDAAPRRRPRPARGRVVRVGLAPRCRVVLAARGTPFRARARPPARVELLDGVSPRAALPLDLRRRSGAGSGGTRSGYQPRSGCEVPRAGPHGLPRRARSPEMPGGRPSGTGRQGLRRVVDRRRRGEPERHALGEAPAVVGDGDEVPDERLHDAVAARAPPRAPRRASPLAATRTRPRRC